MTNDRSIRYGELTKYFAFKTREKKIPFSGTFELTPLCNMDCKMCYIHMTEKEMEKVGTSLSVQKWLQIARDAVKDGMVMLLLTGGEPILYKGFRELYLELRKMGLFISINSNGTAFTDEWIEFFRQNPPAKFNLTIYGGSNETYQRLCGNPRGFDQLKSNVEKLQAAHIDILMNCTLTKQNVDDMEAIFQFGRQHHLEIHATTYNFPPVRKEGVSNPALNRMTPLEAAKARIRLNWNSFEQEKDFLAWVKLVLADIGHAVCTDTECGTVEGDRVQCAAGRSNFWITWDGRLLPCGMIPDFSVSLHEISFDDAWKQAVAHTAQIRLPVECANCFKKSICLPCAAKITAETGGYSQKADYMCAYTDEYIRLLKEAVAYLEQENH